MDGSAGQGFRAKYFRHRVIVLLLVLIGVTMAYASVRTDELRPVDWSISHRVLVVPLVLPGADAGALEGALARMDDRLESWFADQLGRWREVRGEPLVVRVAEPRPVGELPPRLPEPDDGLLERIRRTRAFLSWFEQHGGDAEIDWPDPTRLYLVVHPAADVASWQDRHSVGTRRERVGVVFAADDPSRWGNALAVTAHEILHTIGAVEHRDESGAPSWPEGLADPSRTPLLPQEQAEAMALGIPVDASREHRVTSLDQLVLGGWTAAEIGWIGAPPELE